MGWGGDTILIINKYKGAETLKRQLSGPKIEQNRGILASCYSCYDCRFLLQIVTVSGLLQLLPMLQLLRGDYA